MHGAAETAAGEMLRMAWVKGDGEASLPVEPQRIAMALGLKYYVADLGRELSGMLVRPANHDAEIHVNRDDSEVRRRFSCAHELGHYVLQSPEEGLPTDEGGGHVFFRGPLAAMGSDPAEVWANKFAAALLMPRDLVEEMRAELPEMAILAGRFSVSVEAMRYRLQGLAMPRV
jgi:Zn-dependent peptidase ImmA (M78 family)